jgi:hypothetical protein
MKPPRSAPPDALALIEDAMHLLRRTPAGDFVVWLLGAVPFTVGVLFFWAEMSRAAFAENHLLTSAWGLAGLFGWLKTCQAVFGSRLLARASADETDAWTASRWARAFVTQATWQPLGLFVLPVALVVTLPFGWLFALAQNLGVLADRAEGRPGECLRQAWRQCLLWPGQNHALLSLLTVAWLVASLNAGIALFTLPHLLKMLFGVESRLTLSPGALLNTTFLAVAFALGALAVDPLVKAAYAIRCLHGLARHNGDDLRARLKLLRRLGTAAVVAWLVIAPPAGLAAETSSAPLPGDRIEQAALDRAISDVLEQAEFTWRSPRDWQLPRSDAALPWLDRQMKALNEQFTRATRWLGGPFKSLRDWLDSVFAPKTTPLPKAGNWSLNVAALVEFLMWLLVVVVAAVLLWFAFRIWRPRAPAVEAVPTGAVVPDLRAEFVAADQLPEDEWITLANRLMDEGDFRLALRAYYLAALAHLARREFIRLAKFKSNHDYAGELRRRARARPEVVALFGGAVREFDRVWYGSHEITPEGMVAFATQVEELRRA